MNRYAAIKVSTKRKTPYVQFNKKIITAAITRGQNIARNRIKGPIRPNRGKELKFVDTTLTNLGIDTTGTVTALNLTAVGDDNTTRDGRQVTIKSVQLKGLISPADGTVAGPNRCRIMLVWDNAVNSGTIATIAQILTSATSVAFPLVDNAQRFTILWDMPYYCGVNDTAATLAVSDRGGQLVDYYRKLNNITQYSGTTAAIGSIQNGGLLLVTVGNQAAANGYILNGQARVRFVDQ